MVGKRLGKMATYLETTYDVKRRPASDYPSLFAQHLFDRFNMRAGQTLLDVGCGRGDFTNAFRALGLHVSAVDHEIATSDFLKGIDVKKCNLEKETFPYQENTFDFVFSKSVIEHMWDAEHFLREHGRVLKKGGVVLCLTPDWMSQYLIFYNDNTHKRPYTKESLRRAFSMADFEKIHIEHFYQLPLVWKYPPLLLVSRFLQKLGPVRTLSKNRFYRWSRELMLLGSCVKP
jgi:SAM-dependent methyltransferase